MQITKQKLDAILKDRFGLESFREGQFDAIYTLMKNNNLLCIQPTGHGKSLLYQLPTVLLDGLTLVISPLLALMRDQISQLDERFNISALSINSDQSKEENFDAKKKALAGKIEILFVAPEQLDDIDRFNFLMELPISLIVIDEAHCISTWGHDFRPSYRQIIKLVQKLENKNPAIKILGLTATANNKTEKDIKKQLSTNAPIHIQRASMDRPNIHLSTMPINSTAQKLLCLKQIAAELSGEGLVYCATRENSELVAKYCQDQNIKAAAYHAGLDPDKKIKLQKEFIKGKYKIIAATNALGMGIDKPNLRFIIHFDIPGSITAYYQEIGRSGRDGLPAQGILFYDPRDKKIQQHFINSAQPTKNNFDQILDIISNAAEPPNLAAIKRLSGLHPTLVTVIVAELLEQDLIKKEKRNGLQIYIKTSKNIDPDLTRYNNQYKTKTNELNAILNYGEQKEKCRMLILREALGDELATPCNRCDICLQKPLVIKETIEQTTSINNWLTDQTVPIKTTRINNIATGLAILDGKLRAPLFIDFMKQRANKNSEKPLGLDENLLELIKKHLTNLKEKHGIQSIIQIPSRTWTHSENVAIIISKILNIPLVLDFLYWQESPLKRQGELLNNDQRIFNVNGKMSFERSIPSPPTGPILLLDDYIGSGATIREASNVLRNKAHLKQKIIPFTIAAVKWRLGQSGMV